MNQTLLLTKR